MPAACQADPTLRAGSLRHGESLVAHSNVVTVPQLVVGAIIVDSLSAPSAVLAARRSKPPELAGKWEFPGGKVEVGETPPEALTREIREELGVDIQVGHELTHTDGAWPVSEKYALLLFFATSPQQPEPGDSHDALRWLTWSQLGSVDWLPSDAGAVSILQQGGAFTGVREI